VSALLQVEEVDAYYGPIQALHGVSLQVQDGEIVAVIGANGTGKTTLLRAISGIVPPRSGDIRFEGQSIVGLDPEKIVRRRISHVPERRELFSTMTVLENLELGAYHRRGRAAKAEVQHDVESIWEMFPILRARQKQMAGTLSGGEQQMLAIARGLMARPKLLLLDEPSLGLAPLLVQEVLRFVTLLREMGRTVLLVEQNASGALQIANHAYLMEVGRIVLQGTAQELLENPRVRRAYLGQRIAPPRRPHKIKRPPQQAKAGSRRPDGTRRATFHRAMKGEEPVVRMLSETLPSITRPPNSSQQALGLIRSVACMIWGGCPLRRRRRSAHLPGVRAPPHRCCAPRRRTFAWCTPRLALPGRPRSLPTPAATWPAGQLIQPQFSGSMASARMTLCWV